VIQAFNKYRSICNQIFHISFRSMWATTQKQEQCYCAANINYQATARWQRQLQLGLITGLLALESASPGLAMTAPGSQICGDPQVSENDQGTFLWKSCDDDVWHLRVAANDTSQYHPWMEFNGTLASSKGLTMLTPVNINPDFGDYVKQEDEYNTNFLLNLSANTGIEGFDFSVPDASELCFEVETRLATTALPIYIGSNRTIARSTGKFNPENMGECGSVDDPNTLPRLFITDTTANESNGIAVTKVTLSQQATQTIFVNMHTVPGTAQGQGVDYRGFFKTIKIDAGQTSVDVNIALIKDQITEGTETFGLKLTGPRGATIADDTAVVTILDTDVDPGEPNPWDPNPTAGPIIQLSDFARPDIAGQTELIQAALSAASGGRLVIPPGRWLIRADRFGTLIPDANTTIELKGGAVLEQEPSALFRSVSIITLQHPNTHVRGKGMIKGDLRTHIGTEGENVFLIWARDGASDWSIIGPTLTQSWGDGIMITGIAGSIPVDGGFIDHVISDDNRRQGISVVFSENLIIGDNVILRNTGQLASTLGLPRQRPTAGLDVEPEVWGWVTGLQVGRVISDNNIGGGYLVQSPFVPNTAVATFNGSIATRNGIALDGPPHAGFEIKEGGFSTLNNVRSDDNFGAGVGVYGAKGGRTNQGKIDAQGGTASNNGTFGWELANDQSGGGNILNGVTGNNNAGGLISEKITSIPNVITLAQ